MLRFMGGGKLRTRRSDFRVSMTENNRLNESTDWIDLGFLERERTSPEAIKKGFLTIWQDYRFRILLSYLKSPASS